MAADRFIFRRLPVVLLAIGASGSLATAEAAATAVPANVAKVIEARCAGCHGGNTPEAGVRLDGEWTAERLVSVEGNTWFRALHEIESKRMPPEEEEQPTDAERATVAGWIRGDLAKLQREQQVALGRAQLRRLSREEYSNTIYDLFGFRPPVTVLLPEDGRVDGYQKVAQALPLSAASVDGAMRLADRIVERLLAPSPAVQTGFKRYRALPSAQSGGHLLVLDTETVVSFNSDANSGNLETPNIPAPGLYKIRLSVYGYQTDKPLPFGIYAGATGAYPQNISLLDVLDAPPGKPAVLETEIYLGSGDMNEKWENGSGDSIRVVPFGLGVPVPKNTLASDAAKQGKPGLAVQWIELAPAHSPSLAERFVAADFPPEVFNELRGFKASSRHYPPGTPWPVSKLKSVKPDEFVAIMEKTIRRVAPRLFRRDLTEDEVAAMTASVKSDVDAGRNAFDIVAAQFRNLLMDPDFFCIVEEPGPLTDFALASRLSYLLWNSTPDEQLLELARRGKLRDPVALREQTDRMLADPKGKRFYKGFASQWLRLAAIDDTTPDPKLFPEYHRPENDLLKWSSVAETESFLELLVKENASVRELVDSRRVLANAVLARHYGLPEVFGSGLREISLPEGSPFGGLWTQPAVMKVTANGTNTSPVKRGVFVAERLLGVHIPPPPPNIEPISSDTSSATTLKEKLALHSGKGSCAACHAKFDGYGFALESFDPVGTFREFYRAAAETTVAWKGGGPEAGQWGEKSGAASHVWTGGSVPAPNDHVVISGTTSGSITYDKPLYGDAGSAVFAIALGNQTPGEATQLVTSADLTAKRVFFGPGGRWLHRAGTGTITDGAAIDGGEVEVAGGDFVVGRWPVWRRLEISRGGRVAVTAGSFGVMDLALPNSTLTRHVIGSVGEGALAVSGSSRLELRGVAQVGNGPNGRGEVVLDTSEPIRSAGQWDVQHGRLVIGKNSGPVSCERGTPPKQGCYRVGMSGAPAVLDKLGESELARGWSQDEPLVLEVGPAGTVNWHGGGMRANPQGTVINAGVFNYLDATGTNAFNLHGPVVNAAGGRFHWQGAAGMSMYKAPLRNEGLLTTGHDGPVTLLADLVLEKSGTFQVGLGKEEKTGIVVGNREGGGIKLDGRLEIAPLAGADAAERKLGGRTFTILARGKDAPAITGKFSSTSDDIAKVDYSDEAVTITLVENPAAKPAEEPAAAAAPITFAAADRLDAAGLAAAQRKTPGWNDDRPAWRDHLAVESAGALPDGRPFADIKALRKMLSERPDQLARGVASHLLTYGTGTRPLGVDAVAIEQITAQAKPEGYGFRSLVHAVIQSDLFRNK
jgi:mono/diheme cytochrome c family protein